MPRVHAIVVAVLAVLAPSSSEAFVAPPVVGTGPVVCEYDGPASGLYLQAPPLQPVDDDRALRDSEGALSQVWGFSGLEIIRFSATPLRVQLRFPRGEPPYATVTLATAGWVFDAPVVPTNEYANEITVRAARDILLAPGLRIPKGGILGVRRDSAGLRARVFDRNIEPSTAVVGCDAIATSGGAFAEAPRPPKLKPVSWAGTDRVPLRATPDGDVSGFLTPEPLPFFSPEYFAGPEVGGFRRVFRSNALVTIDAWVPVGSLEPFVWPQGFVCGFGAGGEVAPEWTGRAIVRRDAVVYAEGARVGRIAKGTLVEIGESDGGFTAIGPIPADARGTFTVETALLSPP